MTAKVIGYLRFPKDGPIAMESKIAKEMLK